MLSFWSSLKVCCSINNELFCTIPSFINSGKFADIILVFKFSISKLGEYRHLDKPNIIVVPVSANVLCNDLGTGVN